jgi:hypothetical protein
VRSRVMDTRPRRFLIIDHAPRHNLDTNGKQWLGDNAHRIAEL